MYSHIMLGARDIDASKKFYDATLGALGTPAGFADPKGRVFWRSKTGVFAITKPIDGKDASAANGGTIGFAAESTAAVDAWHKAGLANGGKAIEDPPGIREGAAGKLYIAYLRDPAGNKICAMHRLPKA
jgi:catechol 2,3-dioxygenase-like lactoylglutathione lyase family enzyme